MNYYLITILVILPVILQYLYDKIMNKKRDIFTYLVLGIILLIVNIGVNMININNVISNLSWSIKGGGGKIEPTTVDCNLPNF